MVCQRLALIMGLVSMCLCKWHARVRGRVCVQGKEHMDAGGAIIFLRG